MSATTPASNASEGTTFAALGLSQALCDAVAQAGYTQPTPIQQAAIPALLEGRDLLGCAQTGSGKTAAFSLPLLQRLTTSPEHDRTRHVRALVLAPTRELAAQIDDCIAKYSAGTGLRHLVIFGGVNKNPQLRALREPPEVLVACPGRLLDLMQTEGLSLRGVECLVLDEADRMLDMGFIHDVRKIIAALPAQRQNLLFSATMPKEIEGLARKILHEPKRVAVDPVSSTAPPIEQAVYAVDPKQKQALLTHLLASDPSIDRALVFTRTKHGANRVAQKLERAGITAAAIHGNKSQNARERALAGFRDGTLRVVVATDLASRGIDVKQLSHVFNFELPNIAETYVHRVGRTGRAGASGVAISFCAPDERAYLRDIERLTGKALDRRSVAGMSLEDEGPEPPRAPRPMHGRGRQDTARRGGGGGGGPSRRGGRGANGARDASARREENPRPARQGGGEARPNRHGPLVVTAARRNPDAGRPDAGGPRAGRQGQGAGTRSPQQGGGAPDRRRRAR